MPLTRRSLILGATGSLALVGALGVYRVTRLPQTAIAPWNLGPPPADARLDALRHAVLAPNPHNIQPWLLRLEGDDRVIVSCDPDRRLPQTDPFDRQIVIGFGCFLELARVAATQRGYRVEIAEFPEGEPQPRLDGRPVAVLEFHHDPAITPDPLGAAILARRSNKVPYDLTRPVAAETLAALAAGAPEGVVVAGSADPARVEPLRDVNLEAFDTEYSLPRTHEESVALMRIGHAEIDATPDGIDLDGPMIEALRLAGQIGREQLADPGSVAYRQGRDITRAILGNVPACLWVKTPGNGRRDQLAAGRAYVRANLAATSLGLAMHPMSHALQEFPEMAEPFARLHALLAEYPRERVQMLARIGYGPRVPPSPRWPLESRILPA